VFSTATGHDASDLCTRSTEGVSGSDSDAVATIKALVGTATTIKAHGAVEWVGAWHRRAQHPPIGRPGWKRQSLTGGAAPK
jgi:hypothetical protein